MAVGAVVQFSPKPADPDVDGAIERVGVRSAGVFQELVASQDALRSLDEGLQKRELAAWEAC